MPNKPKPITRRDFIRGTIGATFATSMFGVKWALGDEKTVRSSLFPAVVLDFYFFHTARS